MELSARDERSSDRALSVAEGVFFVLELGELAIFLVLAWPVLLAGGLLIALAWWGLSVVDAWTDRLSA